MPHPRSRFRALVVAALSLAIVGTMATAAHASPSKADLEKQIDAASNQLEDITESFNKIKIQIQQTSTQEAQLQASLGPAQAALKDANVKLGTVVQHQYMQGRMGTMNALLSGGTSDDMMDRLGYLDEIAKMNQTAIDNYTETTQTFAQRKAALEATKAKQTAQLNELNARKAKIESDIKGLKKLRIQAYGSATETGVAGAAGDAPDIAGGAGSAVSFAYKQANKPAYYGYGDSGPNTFDCSGLVMAAWATAGKSLPHNAAAQYHATARISKGDLQPGDLVFYRSLAHVGLYVGGGMIIDASREGEPIKKRTMNIMTPYGYGRVR